MGALVSPSYITLVTVFCQRHMELSPQYLIYTSYYFYVTPRIPLYAGGMRLLYALLTLPLSQLGVCTGVTPPSDVPVVNCITPPQLPYIALSTEGAISKLSSIPRWRTPTHSELDRPPVISALSSVPHLDAPEESDIQLCQSLCVAKTYIPSLPQSILQESYNPVAAKTYSISAVHNGHQPEDSLYTFSPRSLSDLDSLLLPQGVDLQNHTLFLNDLGLSLHSYIAKHSPPPPSTTHTQPSNDKSVEAGGEFNPSNSSRTMPDANVQSAKYAKYESIIVSILRDVLDQLCNLHAIGFLHNDIHLGNICTFENSPLRFLFPRTEPPHGFLIDYGTSRPIDSPSNKGNAFFKADSLRDTSKPTPDSEMEVFLKILFYVFRYMLFTSAAKFQDVWEQYSIGKKYSEWGSLVLFSYPGILFAPYANDAFSPPNLLPLYECLFKRKWLLHLIYDCYRRKALSSSNLQAFAMKYLTQLQDFFTLSLNGEMISEETSSLCSCLPPAGILLDDHRRLSHAALLLLHPIICNLSSQPLPEFKYLLNHNLCLDFIELINAFSTFSSYFSEFLSTLKSRYPPGSNEASDANLKHFTSRFCNPSRYFADRTDQNHRRFS